MGEIGAGYSLQDFHGNVDRMAEPGRMSRPDPRLIGNTMRRDDETDKEKGPHQYKARQIYRYTVKCWDKDLAPSADVIGKMLKPAFDTLARVAYIARQKAEEQAAGPWSEILKAAEKALAEPAIREAHRPGVRCPDELEEVDA